MYSKFLRIIICLKVDICEMDCANFVSAKFDLFRSLLLRKELVLMCLFGLVAR